MCAALAGSKTSRRTFDMARVSFGVNPSFTIAAVLSLALGIGANTAIFTLVDATMLKPLPVREPGMARRTAHSSRPIAPGRQAQTPFPTRRSCTCRSHATTVDVIASHQSNFFVAVGNAPAGAQHRPVRHRRLFHDSWRPCALWDAPSSRSDDRAGAASVVVLSHRYWQRRFGGDRSVIGRTLRLDNRLFTVAGVAPSSFRGLIVARDVDFWVPLVVRAASQRPSQTSDAGYNWLQLVGRVRSGRSLEEARAELTALFHAAVVEPKLALVTDPDRDRPVQSVATQCPIGAHRTGNHAPAVRRTADRAACDQRIGSVDCVCERRQPAAGSCQQPAPRSGGSSFRLGAGRATLIRQLLTESVLLSAAGTALGVMLAYGVCDYLVRVLRREQEPDCLGRWPGPARPHVRRGARACDGGAVRTRAGVANDFARCAGRIAPERQLGLLGVAIAGRSIVRSSQLRSRSR